MDTFWKAAISRQLGAAIDMLENAIRACPDEVWSQPSQAPQWKTHDVVGFWYVAFHTLFFLDYNLSGSPADFAPPAPFTLAEMDPEGLLPELPYTKDELLHYLEHCRAKLPVAAGGVEAEALLSALRHVQHHAGQLNLLLRQSTRLRSALGQSRNASDVESRTGDFRWP